MSKVQTDNLVRCHFFFFKSSRHIMSCHQIQWWLSKAGTNSPFVLWIVLWIKLIVIRVSIGGREDGPLEKKAGWEAPRGPSHPSRQRQPLGLRLPDVQLMATHPYSREKRKRNVYAYYWQRNAMQLKNTSEDFSRYFHIFQIERIVL